MSRSEGSVSTNESSPERLASIPDLLARIRSGDEEAARELLNRYESKVRMVVRRQLPRLLRSRFDSIDFLQSVWGSFFDKIKTGPTDLQEEQNLIAFLAWAARNKVIDECRRAVSQKQNVHREERTGLDGPAQFADRKCDTPSQVAQAHETYDRLRELLPEDRRVILELKAAGHSCKEIGDRLGLSERTVERVLENLRNLARAES